MNLLKVPVTFCESNIQDSKKESEFIPAKRLNRFEEYQPAQIVSEEPIIVLIKDKKKFFQRKGVKIGCFVLGTGLLAGGLYALLHKKAVVPEHATMSGGRPFEDPGTTTGEPSTDTGGSGGGRGD